MILAILAVAGAQWTVLQSIAWTTMLANNLRTHSFTVAVEHTFDGKYPCCLCKAITKAKKGQKRAAFAPQLKRFEFPLLERGFVLVVPKLGKLRFQFSTYVKSVALSPPTPPPISIPA